MSNESGSGLREKTREEAYRELRHEMAVSDVDRALRMARLRCLSFEELVSRLGRIWEVDESSSVVYALCERSFTPTEEGLLSDALTDLGQVGDGLRSHDKAKVDRAIGRVSRCMSPERACHVVVPFLAHPRKARRQIAYRVLKAVPVTAEFGKELVERYRQTGDEELLELVARSSEAVCRVDVRYVLESLGEEYWRARVLAALLATEPAKAYELADAYPVEFVHAVGRQEDHGALEAMRKLFRRRRRDPEFLSIYAWCLGILRATDHLRAVARAFEKMQKELPTKGSTRP